MKKILGTSALVGTVGYIFYEWANRRLYHMELKKFERDVK